MEGLPYHDVFAVIDPLSLTAQSWAPYLSMLVASTNIRLRLVLNPKQKVSESPLKRFFRVVLPRIEFSPAGVLEGGPTATFKNMPIAPLLTLGMQTPAAWMVQAIYSPYDLDNIHLQSAKGSVQATFELEYILVEGTCISTTDGQPTRGLQLQLENLHGESYFDTIVMANMGYFQLKATPGAWHLRLSPGRSVDIFEFQHVDGADSHSSENIPLVILNDFSGKTLSIQVRRIKSLTRLN